MTSTNSLEDIKRWLNASTLSDQQKQEFIQRYEAEGHWTPQLANEFAEIIIHSIDTYEEEMEQYAVEAEQKLNELDKIHEDMNQEYREYVLEQYKDVAKAKQEVSQRTGQIKRDYDEILLQEGVEDLNGVFKES